MAKQAVDKRIRSIRVKGILQQIFGWLAALFFGIPALVGFLSIRQPSDVGFSTFCLILSAGSFFLIVLGTKNLELIKTFQNYTMRLAQDPAKSIDSLAASLGVPVEKVTKNVSVMLKKRLIQDAYIDKQTNCLVSTNPQQSLQQPLQQPIQPPVKQAVPDAASHPASQAVVQCHGCGAMNKIVMGSVGTCDFCGSPIAV